MPKSVHHYVLYKGQYFDPETSFTQSCFPNKETDGRWRVKQFKAFIWGLISFLIASSG